MNYEMVITAINTPVPEGTASLLTEKEKKLLLTRISEVQAAGLSREVSVRLNNKTVNLVRARMAYEVSGQYRRVLQGTLYTMAKTIGDQAAREWEAGARVVRFRRGLHLPAWFVQCYQEIVSSQDDRIMSGVLQNAIVRNEAAGERSLWKNR